MFMNFFQTFLKITVKAFYVTNYEISEAVGEEYPVAPSPHSPLFVSLFISAKACVKHTPGVC